MNIFTNLISSISTGDTAEILFVLLYLIVYLCFYLCMLFFILAIATAAYVFQGIGLSKMLKKVGYAKPWHAWVPFANVYALGSRAEMYDDGKAPTNYGRTLLRLNIALSILSVALFSFELPMFAVAAMAESPALMIFTMLAYFGLLVALIVMAIIQSIKLYITYWRVFRIFHPEFSVLYLMLSIFVSSYVPSVVFFILRNREPQNLRAPEGCVCGDRDSENSEAQNPYTYE